MTDTDADAAKPNLESMLPDLKTELGAECNGVIDEHLLMFLQWKPSVSRAAQRFRDMRKWKHENPGMFDDTLRITKDPEIERILAGEFIVSPPGLKTKAGGPVIIGRFRNNDMTDGRTADGVCRSMFYFMDRLLHRPETLQHGITVVHDLRGFDRSKNARLEIAKRLFRGFIGQFPLKINAIYICHAPAVFIGFFKIVSMIMPGKIKSRVTFINDFSELDTVHGVLDPSNLLPEMGGTLEWSVQDWVNEQKLAEESGDWKSLTTLS